MFAEWYTKDYHSSQLTIWQVKVRAGGGGVTGVLFKRTHYVQYKSQQALFKENLLVHLLIEICRWLSITANGQLLCRYKVYANQQMADYIPSVFFNIWVGLSRNCRWSMVHLKKIKVPGSFKIFSALCSSAFMRLKFYHCCPVSPSRDLPLSGTSSWSPLF